MLGSLVPRSLRTHLILSTLGIILLVQAATVATVSYYRKQYTEQVAVHFTATTIRTLRASLAEIPTDQRADFVRQASQNEWHLWSRNLPAEANVQERRLRPRRGRSAQTPP
ncbi:MAG TPA: ATPase, partial [Paralcaligenes sp.]